MGFLINPYVFSGAEFIGFTSASGDQVTSRDGETWASGVPNLPYAPYNSTLIGGMVAASATRIVVASNTNGIQSSTDGVAFAQDTSYWTGASSVYQPLQMAYGDGYFVGIPQSSFSSNGRFAYSADGISWTGNAGITVTSYPVYRAVRGGSGWAFFGVSGFDGYVWYDTDITKSTAWSKRNFDSSGSRAAGLESKAAYGNGYFLCTTNNGESTPGIYYVTEASVLTSWTFTGISGAVFFGGLAYESGAGRWATLYTDSSNNIYRAYSDNDGAAWSSADTTLNCFDATSLWGPFEIGGDWYACYRNAGGDYKIIRSTDGATWTEQTAPNTLIQQFIDNPFL